jgi:uncharacterized protein (TIGR03435 family)
MARDRITPGVFRLSGFSWSGNRAESRGVRYSRLTMVRPSRIAILLLALWEAVPLAQSPPASNEPAFEVVSVKLNPRDDVPEALALEPNGDVRFTAFPLRTLIAMAYRAEGIQRFDQLVDGPAWMATDRFDISAKVAETVNAATTSTRMLVMLRGVLRDRFGLRVHAETRSLPAFALVRARGDDKLGPELHQTTTDCSGGTTGSTQVNRDERCGIHAAAGVITGRAVPASQLAGNLSGYPMVDRLVIDRTGLTGGYDFTLQYSPTFLQGADAGGSVGPSLFTALVEQLGLRLEPETITAPVLVIDHVEKPTAD